MTFEFQDFGKIPRLRREIVITEKIDGTNAQVFVSDDGEVQAGSRSRWITPEDDNYGFAAWVRGYESELRELGPGRHFGEWWGSGINRAYGYKRGERFFSLFNVTRWGEERPACCSVVPVLWRGVFTTMAVDLAIADLARNGSRAAPGFDRPEGVIVFHVASNGLFKQTILKDDEPKGRAK